jgi:subtilisin family serine protease
MEYADLPVTVVVQLEKPSLIEYVNQQGMTRDSKPADQQGYVAELASDQAAVLGQISAGREGAVQQIGDSFTKVLNGFMLKVPVRMVNEIRAISGVAAVSRAPEYKINLDRSVSLIGAPEVWNVSGATGRGVTVAVIDTGIDYTHAAFGGSGDPADYAENDPTIIEDGTFPTMRVIGGYDFAGTAYDAGDDLNNIPVPDEDPLDEGGHGTHVASTIASYGSPDIGPGVAPEASLYALKIFGADGSTSLTLQAIEWAMDPQGLGHLGEPVDVINMSLGTDWGPADETAPEFIAVENAVSIGVVVVASAGNAGNSSYVVGSPSVADSAISVAASSTGFMQEPFIQSDSLADIPYFPSSNPIDEAITAEMVDVSVAIDPSGELCTVPEGQEDALLDKIALISRGNCSFGDKINNAEALGAVAAVIYNNEEGIISMDAGESTLPAGSVLQTDGIALQGIAPATITIGPDSMVQEFEDVNPPDTIGSFSSRGPRGFDSKLKPEITAPGVNIYAADMGSGILGTSKNGTSMAAPHVAGVAALLLDSHPGWSPTHVKAAMMNTAVELEGDATGDVPRIGAGRVDASSADNTPVVAYADPKLVSLSWGVIELKEDYSDTKTITLRNFIEEGIGFNVSAVFTSASDGAMLSFSEDSVIVPPNSATSVDVTLDLFADELSQSFVNMEEYYGYVIFSAEELMLKVPFYFIPRPYTELSEVDSALDIEVDTEMGYVDFDQSGPIASELWAFPVSLTSENDPDILDAGDLRYVGMDYGWYSDDYGDVFMPAFGMWGGSHTNQLNFNDVDLYIYSPYGAVVNFNYNYGAMSTGDGTNEWIVVQIDLNTGTVYLGSPYDIYADFNSGFQEWYLPASWQYVLDEFTYEVYSYDWLGNEDYAGFANFDLSRLPWAYMTTNDFPHNESASFMFIVDDWAGFRYADIKGVMLVDYNGKPGEGQAYYWPISVHKDLFMPMFVK